MKTELTTTKTAEKPFTEVYAAAVKGLKVYTGSVIAGHLLKQIEHGSRIVLLTSKGKLLNANDIQPLTYLLSNYPVNELWLQHCAINDEAVELLANAVKSQSSLGVLGFTDTKLTSKGKMLLEALELEKNGITFNFRNTHIEMGKQPVEKQLILPKLPTPNIIIHSAEAVEQGLENNSTTKNGHNSISKTLDRRNAYKHHKPAQSTIGFQTIGKSAGTSTATTIYSMSEPTIEHKATPRQRSQSFDSPVKPEYVKEFSIHLPRHLSREICKNYKVYVGSEILIGCIKEVVVNQYNTETKKRMVDAVTTLAPFIASHLQKELNPLADISKKTLDASDGKAFKKLEKDILQKLTEMPDYREKVKRAVTAGIEQAGFGPELHKVTTSMSL